MKEEKYKRAKMLYSNCVSKGKGQIKELIAEFSYDFGDCHLSSYPVCYRATFFGLFIISGKNNYVKV